MESYEKVEGHIGRTHAESQPWWPKPAQPGEQTPNVIVMLLDDRTSELLGTRFPHQ